MKKKAFIAYDKFNGVIGGYGFDTSKARYADWYNVCQTIEQISVDCLEALRKARDADPSSVQNIRQARSLPQWQVIEEPKKATQATVHKREDSGWER